MFKYLLIVVSVVSLYFSPRISVEQIAERVQLPLQIFSSDKNGLDLYITKNSRVKYKLALGESVLYQYAGETGKWLYGIYRNKPVIVKDQRRKLGYRLPFFGLVEQRLFKYSTEVISLIFCMLSILYIFFSHRRKINTLHKLVVDNKAYHLKEITAYFQEIQHYKDSNLQLAHRNSELSDTNKKLKEKIFLSFQKEKDNQYLLKQKDNKIAELKSSQENLINEQKELLSAEFIKSAETKYLPKIKDMQELNDKLATQLTLIKEQAKVFDVNFDDHKFSGLLKGRQFEIFVASAFYHKHECEILEWTPDKGFNKGIKVKVNKNADLLLKDKQGNTFAVECKYRGDYYFYTRHEVPCPRELSWGTKQQGFNYKKYGEDKKADVYVAIGFRGDASNPDSNYLVPLNQLFKKSIVKKDQNKKNYVLTIDSITDFKVEESDFYDLVKFETPP